jgi:hypothetical protein
VEIPKPPLYGSCLLLPLVENGGGVVVDGGDEAPGLLEIANPPLYGTCLSLPLVENGGGVVVDDGDEDEVPRLLEIP